MAQVAHHEVPELWFEKKNTDFEFSMPLINKESASLFLEKNILNF